MEEMNVPQYQQLLRRATANTPSPAMPPAFPPGLEDFNNVESKPHAPSPNSVPTPFGLKRDTEPKPKVAPKQNTVAQGNIVELGGLPKPLMSSAMIETLVDQAECTKDVHINEISFAQGKAFVSFANPDDAAAFITHCHGRPWNPKGPPVTAMLYTPTKGGAKKTKPQKNAPKPNGGGAASISSRMKLPKPQEQDWTYVNKAFVNQMQYHPFHASNSETSTAAGDSDGEERLGFPLQFGASLQL
jgi:hypothetical protein